MFKKLNKVSVAPKALTNLRATTVALNAHNIEVERIVSSKYQIEYQQMHILLYIVSVLPF